MWNRRQLKRQSFAILKANYSRMIAVCFLVAMLTTSYTTSTTFLNQYIPDTQILSIDKETSDKGLTNSDVITDTVDQIASPALSEAPQQLSTAAQIIIDLYTSGKSIFFSALRFFNNFIADRSPLTSFFLSTGIFISALYLTFVSNIILIGEKRFFLEIRNYPQTRIGKIFFLYKLRYLLKPARTMILRTIRQWLWNITIIGGVMKYYEYSMIPFLLAENPALSSKDAFFLSKHFMQGNKRKMFLLHLSFLGWKILSLFSFGLLDFVYTNPYRTGADTELYLILRKNYIHSRHPKYELLNDALLERIPSEDELLISKALYDDSEGPYTKISYFAPEQYPAFLFSIQPSYNAVKQEFPTDLKYDCFSCIFLFFTYSIFGWLFESAVQLIRNGAILHHDYFLFPWLPLYGLGGLYILLFIRRFSKYPVTAFFLMLLSFSVFTYVTRTLIQYTTISSFIERTYFMQPSGKTILGGILFFTLIGCAFLYSFAPKWNRLFLKLHKPTRMILCILLCFLFIGDLLYGKQYSEILANTPLFSPFFLIP